MAGRRQGFISVPVRCIQCQETLAEVLVDRVGEELFTHGWTPANEPCYCLGLALQGWDYVRDRNAC